MSPPSTMALTRPLRDWLAADPQWRTLPVGWRAAANWRAFWGSVNVRLSSALPPAAGDTQALEDPLFVVGPWRSGTTVMHELLSAATGLATPRTWQCMDACSFALRGRPTGTRHIARPMDGLEIGPMSPQEDEFALLTLGVPSAYRAFLMPHRAGDLHITLDPEFWQVEPGWLAVWEGFLRNVLRTGGPARQPLLLKSPNHTFRLPAILQRFPRARIVWMIRPAAEVWGSNQRMWRQMADLHGVGPRDDAALDALVAQALHRCAEILDLCLQLPPAQLAVVAQPALRDDPLRTISAIWQRLGQGLPLHDTALQDAVARLRPTGAEVSLARTGSATAAEAIARLDAAQRRAQTSATAQ